MSNIREHISSLIISLAVGGGLLILLVVTENPYVLTKDFWKSRDVPLGAISGQVEGYLPVGKRAGLWNDGQAAFWDLNILDHFRLFGAPERARAYKPTQPMRFSHVTHVQQHRMECQYCHWSVTKSPFANLPELQNCVGCHNVNLSINIGTSEAQKKEIAKIKEYADKNEPIPWIKVDVMPDFVRFNHKRHLKAGVACHECHGQIPEMSTVERASSMKMGWCIDCHRQKGTSIDCLTCHK